jgi:hypothetical protein
VVVAVGGALLWRYVLASSSEVAFLLPGTVGGDGAGMVRAFREAAEREKFFVVAPDSRRAPDGRESWEVGGNTAPYVATNAEPYTAFAVLHGGVFADELGKRAVRGWLSTGDSGGLRPPKSVQGAADAARQAGVQTVDYREFHAAHEVGEEEVRELVEWWLRG